MSRNLSLVEPHPSVPKSGGYVGGGRGGAGNFKRYQASDITAGSNATGPASLISLVKPSHRTILGGRGGAGNVFTARDHDEAMFKFDEELIKSRDVSAPVYKIGRGGAGNIVDERKPSSRSSRMGSSGSISSASSNDSAGSFLGRVSRKFSTRS